MAFGKLCSTAGKLFRSTNYQSVVFGLYLGDPKTWPWGWKQLLRTLVGKGRHTFSSVLLTDSVCTFSGYLVSVCPGPGAQWGCRIAPTEKLLVSFVGIPRLESKMIKGLL